MSEFRRRLQFKQESELGEKVYFWRQTIGDSNYTRYSTNPQGETWSGTLTTLPIYSYTSLLNNTIKITRNQNIYQYSSMSYSSGTYSGSSNNSMNSDEINPSSDGWSYGLYCYSPLDSSGHPTAYSSPTNWTSNRLAINIGASNSYMNMVECFHISTRDDKYDILSGGTYNDTAAITQQSGQTVSTPTLLHTTTKIYDKVDYILTRGKLQADGYLSFKYQGCTVFSKVDLTTYNFLHFHAGGYPTGGLNPGALRGTVNIKLAQYIPPQLYPISSPIYSFEITGGTASSTAQVDTYISTKQYTGEWYILLYHEVWNTQQLVSTVSDSQWVTGFGEFELM